MRNLQTRRELRAALLASRGDTERLRELLEWCVGAVQAAIDEACDDYEDTIDGCEKLIEIKEALGLPVDDEDRRQLSEAIRKRDEEEALWRRRSKS